MISCDEKIYKKTKKFLEEKNDPNILEKLKIIEEVLNIKNKEERLYYLYDLICNYLDKEFKDNNICEFKCDICIRGRDAIDRKIKKETYKNGCCYNDMSKHNCMYLEEDGTCKTKNIGCKLFTCHYLKKKGYKYRLNDIYLAKYFFNLRQKLYIESAFRLSKEEVIKGILERG